MSAEDGGYILGALIVYGLYVAGMLALALTGTVATIVHGIRRWRHRNDIVPLWSAETLEAFRQANDMER